MLFWSIYGLSLVFFASPGPINIETVRRGVTGGARSAFFVQLGAIMAECGWALGVVLSNAPFQGRPAAAQGLTLLSAGVLLWIAWGAVRDVRPAVGVRSPAHASRHNLVVGAICAASNPVSAVLWLAVINVSTTSAVQPMPLAHLLLIGSGYLGGSLTWAVLIATFVGWSWTFVQPRYWRWWNVASGVLVGSYALHLLWITLPR